VYCQHCTRLFHGKSVRLLPQEYFKSFIKKGTIRRELSSDTNALIFIILLAVFDNNAAECGSLEMLSLLG
jgi:hypothetical protein